MFLGQVLCSTPAAQIIYDFKNTAVHLRGILVLLCIQATTKHRHATHARVIFFWGGGDIVVLMKYYVFY